MRSSSPHACAPGHACALLAAGALDETDVDVLEPLLPESCAPTRQQVLNRVAVDDLGGARAAADRVARGYSWTGNRDIATVLADRGHVRGFFDGWKSCAAGKERHEMVQLKTRLVTGVAHAAGWRAALELTRDKRVSDCGFDVGGIPQRTTAFGTRPERGERVLAFAVRRAYLAVLT